MDLCKLPKRTGEHETANRIPYIITGQSHDPLSETLRVYRFRQHRGDPALHPHHQWEYSTK
ncbi:hypothetical protein PHLCEN_2v5693 [Hermanssonia centrifuga]|uniref:Uncharacterized protein n=1 Tax=Hermanssonia centrifuga TaxID=98765 RepID=A0A2R6P1N4_9APHY|nr:hypothetical protein PHLCEN_2v5693 [Hermanssonia centrifuga]